MVISTSHECVALIRDGHFYHTRSVHVSILFDKRLTLHVYLNRYLLAEKPFLLLWINECARMVDLGGLMLLLNFLEQCLRPFMLGQRIDETTL